jgi:hypothetical protein
LAVGLPLLLLDLVLWQQFLMIIKLLGAFLQQILQVEILLGDQLQDMLARAFKEVRWRRRTRRTATIK